MVVEQKRLTIYERPERDTGAQNFTIDFMAKELADQKLLVPHFQRDYVWDKRKLISYIQTIISKQAVGVLVTYQLEGGGPGYLADGLQRLTSVSRFLEAPHKYGFEFDREQAKIYCECFTIAVQHRIYSDHDEAMSAFHDLNNGTGLMPREYYKGVLTRNPIGGFIFSSVPAIVYNNERLFTSTKKLTRGEESKYVRDAFGLFLQYVSGAKVTTFWKTASKAIVPTKDSVEGKLMDYIKQHDVDLQEIEKKVENFDRFMAREIKVIVELINESGQSHKPMSRTFSRWLLHMAIWRKNNNRPVKLYTKFLLKLLQELIPYQTFCSIFNVEGVQPPFIVALQSQSLKDFRRLCQVYEIPLFDGFKRKTRETIPGMHNSHIRPFSEYGEGETVKEPGLLNMARGAKEIGSMNEIKTNQ